MAGVGAAGTGVIGDESYINWTATKISDDGAGTLVSYTVAAEVGGRMAQLGGPIIDATAKQLAGKFFARFGEIVSGEQAAAAPAAAPQAAATPAPAVTTPTPATAAPAPAGLPLAWLVALALAILAGFLLGRSAAADWWVIAMIVLAGASAVAGYRSGAGR